MDRQEQQLAWAARAAEIVAEAAGQNSVELPAPLAAALAQAVRTHGLTQPGVFALVEAYANSERLAGRLPEKVVDYAAFKD